MRARPGSGLLWLTALLGLCTWWRAGYVPLLGVRELPLSEVVASLAGALWIDVMVALAFVAGLVATRDRNRMQRWGGAALLLGAFAWSCTARLVDRTYFFYSGDHVDQLALEHFEGDALGMRLDSRMIGFLAVALVGCVVGLALLLLAARAARRVGLRRFFGRAGVPLCGVALVGQLLSAVIEWSAVTGSPEISRLAELRAAPEFRIPALYLQRSWRPLPRVDGLFRLDPVVKNKLRRFGIRVDEAREFPLVKERAFEAPVTFARTAHRAARPNVIVVFFESFSAAMTSLYGGRYTGLTPNLEDFAAGACVLAQRLPHRAPRSCARTRSSAFSWSPTRGTCRAR